MMKTMKLSFLKKSFTALVDMEQHIIFSADIWHSYKYICDEYEEAPKYNFHDYVDEVLENGHYYTSETFSFYNPWESDDCFQPDDEDGWTFFIPGIAWNNDEDELFRLINQCEYKAIENKKSIHKDVYKAFGLI